MSTDPSPGPRPAPPAGTAPDGGDAAGRVWSRSASVALRTEPFGAIAYDFATRRLAVLKSPDLLATVTALDGVRTAEQALTAAGVAAGRRPAVLRALARLADDGMLHPSP